MAESAEAAATYDHVLDEVFLHGNVALALAMARETNLIHSLCTADRPLSASALAAQLQFKKPYVREVLNSLTMAGIIQLEGGTGGKDGVEARYWVPPSCRQSLQTTGNLSLTLSSMARQFSEVRECFDLHAPPCFRYGASSLDAIEQWSITLQDGITEAVLQTPGLRQRLEKGLKASDMGCGRGRLSLHFAAMFPQSQFTLSDISQESIDCARKEADNQGLSNISFQVLDLCQVPDELENTFDWIFCRAVIHDLPYPQKALRGICKALKPGGHFSLIDTFVSSYPAENLRCKDSAALYAMSVFFCIPESYQHPDSEALGCCWGIEKASEMVKAAGMHVLGVTKSEAMGTTAVCMCQKPETE